jgi:hypothetical protein
VGAGPNEKQVELLSEGGGTAHEVQAGRRLEFSLFDVEAPIVKCETARESLGAQRSVTLGQVNVREFAASSIEVQA